MILATSSALKGIQEGALREGVTGIAEGGELMTEVQAIRSTRVFARVGGVARLVTMEAEQRGLFYCATFQGR